MHFVRFYTENEGFDSTPMPHWAANIVKLRGQFKTQMMSL